MREGSDPDNPEYENHPEFEVEPEKPLDEDGEPNGSYEDGKVKFRLATEKLGVFKYYLRVTAMGNSQTMTDELTFTVECGVDSAGIQEVDWPADHDYDIQPSGLPLPFFSFPEYTTTSTLCTI